MDWYLISRLFSIVNARVWSNMRSNHLSRDILNISARSPRIAYFKIHQSWCQKQQEYYHLHTNFRIITNFSGAIALVKMYAFSEEFRPWRVWFRFLRHSGALEKWYLTPMCLLRGVILTALVVASSPLLPSNTVV